MLLHAPGTARKPPEKSDTEGWGRKGGEKGSEAQIVWSIWAMGWETAGTL